jgi:hypothetical protein
VLQVSLGAEIEAVEKRSTVPVTFSKSLIGAEDLLDFLVSMDYDFVYDDPDHGFKINGLRHVGIASDQGRIDSINVKSGWLTLDQGLSFCKEIIRIVDAAGWERSADEYSVLYADFISHKTLSELREAFLNEERPIEGAVIARWTLGEKKIELGFDRRGPRGEPRYTGVDKPLAGDMVAYDRYSLGISMGYINVPAPWVKVPGIRD